MKNKFLLFFPFFIGIGYIFELSAQEMTPNMNVSITSSSDYQIDFSYSNADAAFCECVLSSNRRFKVILHKNGKAEANIENTWSGTGTQYSGEYSWITGPGVNATWYLAYQSYCAGSSCLEWVWGNGVYGGTQPIKSPASITVSNMEYYDKIVLNWSKGSDIPDGYQTGLAPCSLSYKIYRGTTNNPSSATLVATVYPDVFTWTDNTVKPNSQFYYWVTTYTNGFGGHESSRTTSNAKLGKTKTLSMTASDSISTTRVKLSWPSLADFVDEIRVERSIPQLTQKEELEILSKNATAFNDLDAIPGYRYTYYITPIKSGRTFDPISDTGFKKANGTLSGYVKSVMNAGVSGVKITANPVGTLPAGAVSMPSGGYFAYTDIDGYFEIRNIYYFEGADFTLVPSKSIHEFSPAQAERRLDLNARSSSGINFTDESVYTIAGKIIFPTSTIVECGVPNVEIKINGESRGIYTDPDGNWEYTIMEEDTFSFKPEFLHHQFINASGKNEYKIFVNSDFMNLNFTDVQEDSIKVRVQGGCGDPLAEKAYVKVTAAGNCFSRTYETDANGFLIIPYLPAREYSLQVTDLYPTTVDNYSDILDQIGGGKTIVVDLTKREIEERTDTLEVMTIIPGYNDTLPNGTIVVVPPDTTISTTIENVVQEIEPAADFIYHSPLKIVLDFEEAGALLTGCACDDGHDVVLMEQNVPYPIVFEVLEQLGECPVKEGSLRIFDFISDRGDSPVEIPIENGLAFYMVEPGVPEFATGSKHEHEKLLYVIPKVGFLDAKPWDYWVMVTGVKTETSSFTTRSPELPFLVLHDPPGDKSSAFVEEGTVIRNFHTTEYQVGGEAGAFANLLVGAKIKTPFSGHGFGTKINIGFNIGTDEYWRNGFESTITFKEKFSTSDMGNLTGNMGDVFIGASFNQEFSRGEELTFNTDSCKVYTDVVPSIDLTGFATTFVYTEKHIRTTLLPLLGSLRSDIVDGRDSTLLSEEEKIQSNQLLFDSLHWENVLAKNAANRDTNAVFKKNLSFSAGAPYSSEYSSEEKWSESFEYNVFLNSEFLIGMKIDNEGGIWYDSEMGVTAKLRFATKGESGGDSTLTRTVSYTLDDDDMGDFFSVDVKEDTAYGVPAFDLVLGTTSCPHEAETQPRDDAYIMIDPPQINNVPIGGKAVFTANLVNWSQSRETREYSVQVVSTSNPDGALVKLAGEPINFRPASFWIDYGQTNSVSLTVEKGPMAANYDSIGIMMFPSCEMDLWDEGGDVTSGDTAWIFVNFQNECSNVALHYPGDGWMVNQNSNNQLHIAFTGYDANNEMLENITLQYKKEGQGWNDYITVDNSELVDNFYDFTFNVEGLSDGNYRLRAKAYCGVDGGFSYSSEQVGIIDRTSLAPFGMPAPADGYLRLGQEISVVFDKNINCDFSSYSSSLPDPVLRLYTEDGTDIPITVQCSGTENKLILVPDESLFGKPELEGVQLFAEVSNIQDNSENVQKYSTQWSFLVNVSPVSWNPDNVFLTAKETDEVILSANLDNSSLLSKPFEITSWPDWLTPSVTSASILPENSFNVQLRAASGLAPGYYEGQVLAEVDGLYEVLQVSLQLFAADISWNVNQADFEHNMNVTALFSYDEGDSKLSTGSQDKIAAFINGDLRGVGNVSYVPGLDKYAAFINVFSNAAGKNCSMIEGQDNVANLSVQNLAVTDEGTAYRAVRFKKTNWADFSVYASKNAAHEVKLRVASILPGTVQIYLDDVLQSNFNIPNTGNLTSFTTLTFPLTMEKGNHTIRLQANLTEFDLAYIKFPEYHVRNQSCGQVIKFRMWDGLNGIEYGAVEELSFFNDGVVGNAENPFLLHPAGGIQDVVLEKGWTWISVNKESSDMSLGKVFESITAPTSTNSITLKSQTAFSQFSQADGWLGTLSAIDPRLGYMIHLNTHSDTLSMVGSNPENVSLSLNPKWNWIGYPKPGIMAVNDAFEELSASAGDLLKSQFAFAEYNQSTGKWIGSLEFLQPGKGYKLFVMSADTLEMLKSVSPEELEEDYEYTMTLTATVLPDSKLIEGGILKIFIDNQIRGTAVLRYVESLGKNIAFSMIYGDRADIGKKADVMLFDEKQNLNIPLEGDAVLFNIDQISGKPDAPLELRLPENWKEISELNSGRLFTVYPNPFSNHATIRYNLSDPSHVVVSVHNAVGSELVRIVDLKQSAGAYEYTFDAKRLTAGIYYIVLKTDKELETQKVLIK